MWCVDVPACDYSSAYNISILYTLKFLTLHQVVQAQPKSSSLSFCSIFKKLTSISIYMVLQCVWQRGGWESPWAGDGRGGWREGTLLLTLPTTFKLQTLKSSFHCEKNSSGERYSSIEFQLKYFLTSLFMPSWPGFLPYREQLTEIFFSIEMTDIFGIRCSGNC